MSWAAIAKRAEASAPQVHDALVEVDRKQRVVVLDANAIIKGMRFNEQGARFVSTPDVLEEVQDKHSQQFIKQLPYQIETLPPQNASVQAVMEFARLSGDLGSLSAQDCRLLGLARQLEVERHGDHHLNVTPPKPKVGKHLHHRGILPGWGHVANPDDWAELDALNTPAGRPDPAAHAVSRIRFNPVPLIEVAATTLADAPGPGQTASQQVPHSNVRQEPLQSLAQDEIVADNAPLGKQRRRGKRGGKRGGGQQKRGAAQAEEAVLTAGDGDSDEGEQGDWSKARSRTTRRKHEKRASRMERESEAHFSQDLPPSSDHFTAPPQPPPLVSDAQLMEVDASSDQTPVDQEVAGYAVEQGRSGEGHPTGGVQNDEDNDLQNDKDASVEEGNASQLDTAIEGDVGVRANESGEAKEDCQPRSAEFESLVMTVTADFAMQNVLLLMGLKLSTPDGVRIRRTARFVLRCSACATVCKDTTRIFCPSCGNNTLVKVEQFVGVDGAEQYGVRNLRSLRGTKFSLPMPKGGRHRDPILSEDMMRVRYPTIKRQQRQPDNPDPFATEYGPDTWFRFSAPALRTNELKAALADHRHNPNERKLSRSNRRKK